MLRYFLILALFVSWTSAQCNPGAVFNSDQNLCFTFYQTTLDFYTAEATCASSNGHLASIHNTIDNTFLAKQAQKLIYPDGPVWLGAKATSDVVANMKNWKWTDETVFNYANYRVGQPSMLDGPACMQFLAGSAKWLTAECDQKWPFICVNGAGGNTTDFSTTSVKSTSTTLKTPTSTSTTVHTTITKAISTTTIHKTTTALKPTTTTQKTTTCKPKKISRCPSRYTWLKQTNSCYKNVIAYTTFADASTACQKSGDNLASIHSTTENQFLVDISATSLNNTRTFIGLQFKGSTWQWTDGSNVDFLNWARGIPYYKDEQHWTTLTDAFDGETTRGKWHVDSWNHRAHICKRKANF